MRKIALQIESCEFPDDCYFDPDNDIWFRKLPDGRARVGITTVLSFVAGHIVKIKPRQTAGSVESGQSLGTIESDRFVGAVRTPVSGRLRTFNDAAIESPRIVNDFPYEKGWIAEMSSWSESELSRLPKGPAAKDRLVERIRHMRVRCFKAMPDREMNSVGLECAATLANLRELLSRSAVGTVVHVISDDETADIEMVRWTDQQKQELVDSRKEGNLYHFLVRKIND